MAQKTFHVGLCALAVALSAAAVSSRAHAFDEPGSAHGATAFDRFKQLEGQWVGTLGPAGSGNELNVIFKVSAGGSIVTETLFPGSSHEMLNVIHPDGNDVVLTHYCSMGNQPEMKAPNEIAGKELAFKCIRVGNLKSPNDPHMHDVTYTFVNKDTLKTRWTTYAGGKPSGDIVTEIKRKK